MNSYGREIDLTAAFRDAKCILTPGRGRGTVQGSDHEWRLARAQWHYDYGNRTLAERELKDVNMIRRLYHSEGREGYEPMELRR